MRTVASIAAALAAIVLGCRSTPHRKADPHPVRTVNDADLGRLAPDQMGPVQVARSRLHEARDALARAQYRLQQSRHEESWANADRAAAESDRLRAAAALATAKDAGDQRAVTVASDQGEAAAIRAKCAEARLDYARKLVDARDAEVKAAEARARRMEWEVERSKLAALHEAGVPAASKYEVAPVDAKIAEAAKAEDAARARASQLGGIARGAYDAWRALNAQYEARARAIPTG
jgi:hypothetical protein